MQCKDNTVFCISSYLNLKDFNLFVMFKSSSMKLNYRVVVGKHNLKEAEPTAKAYRPTKIIVHRQWNPILLSVG